jgi:thioredoxin-like negative regulator of GroEL
VAPEVVVARAAGEHELALALLLAAIEGGAPAGRDRLRRLMVELFAELGPEHPLATSYRRRLATALY